MHQFGKLELTVKAERNLEKIQYLIVGCVNCQTYDGGEIIWINGIERELIDLFYEFDIPEKQWDSIADNLVCLNCGTESFEVYSDVGVKSEFDIVLDRYIDQTLKKYKPLIKEFDTLIQQTPLLAYSHRFGKKIYNDLKNLEFPITSINGTFYRAREAKSSNILSQEKMMHPPAGLPQEGRYNHSGQSHLYLSNNWETAIEEVIGGNDRTVWTLELEVETVDNILDLSFDWMDTTPETSPVYFALCAQNFISRSDRNHELWKPDYFLTRYIMDCAKGLGYNGIKYNSAKTSYVENVVLFYPDKCVITTNKEPEIRIYRRDDDSKRELIDI